MFSTSDRSTIDVREPLGCIMLKDSKVIDDHRLRN